MNTYAKIGYALTVIAALSIGTYAFMNRTTGTNDGDAGTNATTTKIAQLTLVPFSYFESDEGGGLNFYQISTTSTSNQHLSPALIEKMNAALATDYCGISRPGQPDYRAKLQNTLARLERTQQNKEALPQSWHSWNAEQIRQALISSYHFEHSSKQAMAYNQNGLLSIAQEGFDYCGGAHPNSTSAGITLNTTTGEKIQFPDLFTTFDRDKKEIARIVYRAYTDSFSTDPTNPDQECRDAVNEDMYLGNYLEFTAFTLTPEGVRLQSLGFPHALQVCEPGGSITVPYSKLSTYMKESILMNVEPVIRD